MFEDATPEILRDFFWDDEFRPTWDTMLSNSTTVEECPSTGTMIVKWIRKVSLWLLFFSVMIDCHFWLFDHSFYVFSLCCSSLSSAVIESM